MPDDPHDPLDELDGLLSEEEEPLDVFAVPEPAPSPWEEPPEPAQAEWEAQPEPEPSVIEVPAEPILPLQEHEEEPAGDDLSWVDAVTPEPDDWDDDAPTEDVPRPEADWEAEEEVALQDEDWRDLEDERKMLPVGRVLAGYTELASVPELGLHGLRAWLQTGRATSTLTGPASEEGGVVIDGVRITAPHVDVIIDIGGHQLAATLSVAPGEPALWLGRDALEALLVDPTRAELLSS